MADVTSIMKDGMQVDKWKDNAGENGVAKEPGDGVQVHKKQGIHRKQEIPREYPGRNTLAGQRAES